MNTISNTRKERYRYAIVLLKEFVRTDFKIRYQGSVLGYLWALLRPLFLFIILYVVFVYFLRIGKGIEHWPVAMLLGIVMWNFFSEITNQGLKSIVNNGGLIRKLNFPKYVILLATCLSALINLSINLMVVAVFMFINGVELVGSLLWAPFVIFELLLFALGLALILSTLYVKFRDLNFIWEIIMQALFYGSAIIYPIQLVIKQNQTVAEIMLLNPITQSVQLLRNVVVSPEMPTLYSVSNSIFVSLIPYGIVLGTLLFGILYFKRNASYFAENA
jgi:ABC-2 type transport system permease protein